MDILLILNKKNVPIEKILVLNSLWFWISLVELALIVFLVYKLKSGKKKTGFSDLETKHLKKSKKNKIDMDNLMDSIHKSRILYKELTKKCHPDRYINDSRQKIAEEIFQEISKNERDFKKLNSLKERAINELNINF